MKLLEMIVERILLKNKRFIDALRNADELRAEVAELRAALIVLNSDINTFVSTARTQLNENLMDLQTLSDATGGIDVSLPQGKSKKDSDKPN